MFKGSSQRFLKEKECLPLGHRRSGERHHQRHIGQYKLSTRMAKEFLGYLSWLTIGQPNQERKTFLLLQYIYWRIVSSTARTTYIGAFFLCLCVYIIPLFLRLYEYVSICFVFRVSYHHNNYYHFVRRIRNVVTLGSMRRRCVRWVVCGWYATLIYDLICERVDPIGLSAGEALLRCCLFMYIKIFKPLYWRTV